MNGDKVKKFMQLAGQPLGNANSDSPQLRSLGAQLLLSEVLEYIIHGLGVTPEIGGVRIVEPEKVHYHPDAPTDRLEMLDGLSDVAYTMYWNMHAFGLRLEEAFELVSDNNLEKFVKLKQGSFAAGPIEAQRWHCERSVTWPAEVVEVICVDVAGELYAVGKDKSGKVRKPSSYAAVKLESLI